MDNLFLLLFLLSPVLLLAGLIKPSVYSQRIPQLPNRKRISGFFLLLFILSFVGFGMTAPDIETYNTDQDHDSLESEPKVAGTAKEQETTPEPTSTQVVEEQTITSLSEEDTESINQNLQLIKVTRIIDGDTIEVEGGERVRLIGIDTPETGDCYFRESTDKLREKIGDAEIGMEKDISETDRYGRLLRYVMLGDRNINAEMVSEGYAKAYTYPPDVKHSQWFTSLQSEARSKKLGLWGDVCRNIQPTATRVHVQPSNSPSNNTACTPYACDGPDVDCKDFSSHAQAQAWFNCCGFSANNDPHRLDALGVGDGIACESI